MMIALKITFKLFVVFAPLQKYSDNNWGEFNIKVKLAARSFYGRSTVGNKPVRPSIKDAFYINVFYIGKEDYSHLQCIHSAA